MSSIIIHYIFHDVDRYNTALVLPLGLYCTQSGFDFRSYKVVRYDKMGYNGTLTFLYLYNLFFILIFEHCYLAL